MTTTREQTEDAFKSVTPMLCSDLVKHCHDWIDGWIKTEAAGDLQQCGTLATVPNNHELPRLSTHSPTPPVEGPVSMEIAPPAAPAAAPASPSHYQFRKRR